MTLFTIIGCLIVFTYCIYAMYDVDNLIERYYFTRMKAYDAFCIGFTFGWIIIEFFLKPGPIVLIPLVMTLFNLNNKNRIKARIYHYILFILLAVTSVVILSNELIFKINFWKV